MFDAANLASLASLGSTAPPLVVVRPVPNVEEKTILLGTSDSSRALTWSGNKCALCGSPPTMRLCCFLVLKLKMIKVGAAVTSNWWALVPFSNPVTEVEM